MSQQYNLDELASYMCMLHKQAEGISGKLILSSFGENPETGKSLKPKVKHFQVGDIKGMMNTALKWNSEEHRNVYTPLVVMKLDLPNGKKGSENDIKAVLGFVSDFDGGTGSNYLERMPVSPSMAVETSPNNIQAPVLFDKPYIISNTDDLNYAKQLAKNFTANCNGADHCGSDLSHVWRPPGLLNYPNAKKVKEGRSPEPFLSRIEKPISSDKASIDDLKGLTKVEKTVDSTKEEINRFTRLEYEKNFSPYDLINTGRQELWNKISKELGGDRSQRAAEVFSELFELGYHTGDIFKTFQAYPIGDRYKNDFDLEADILRMANKWFDKNGLSRDGIPTLNNRDRFEIHKASLPLESDLPAREFLFGTYLIARYVTICVAPPGVGKSTLLALIALSLATGENLTGVEVVKPCAVAIVNNEDDSDEMHRKFIAMAKFYNIDRSMFMDNLYLQTGEKQKLTIAKKDPKSKLLYPLHKEDLIDNIIKNNIRVLIVDPFLETHEANENDNNEISQVATMLRDVAKQTNCAICIVHHTRKEQGASSEGHAGNMDSARGAGSLIGVARSVFTLCGMSSNDAKKASIADKDRRFYVRMDDAKGNLALPSENALWFKRESVMLTNGDNVGVLKPAPEILNGFVNTQKNLEGKLMSAVLHTKHFEDLKNGKSMSRSNFATSLIDAKCFIGSETDNRGTLEKRITKLLQDNCIEQLEYRLTMTVQTQNDRNSYRINLVKINDYNESATLPTLH